MTLYSDANAKNTNLLAKPVISKDDGTHGNKPGFCAAQNGMEALISDPISCRGFCKPIPTECVEGTDRLCRISNWDSEYRYMRIYSGVNMDLVEL